MYIRYIYLLYIGYSLYQKDNTRYTRIIFLVTQLLIQKVTKMR